MLWVDWILYDRYRSEVSLMKSFKSYMIPRKNSFEGFLRCLLVEVSRMISMDQMFALPLGQKMGP